MKSGKLVGIARLDGSVRIEQVSIYIYIDTEIDFVGQLNCTHLRELHPRHLE